jgi:hypothetical protein
VQKLPPARRLRSSFYDDILKEFIESNLKYAEVKEMGRKPVTIALTLRDRLKKRSIQNIKVIHMKNKVYLQKIE